MATKNAHSGTPMPRCRDANTGNIAPRNQSHPPACLPTHGRSHEDDENGRNPHAEPAIVLVLGFTDGRRRCRCSSSPSCGPRCLNRLSGHQVGDVLYHGRHRLSYCSRDAGARFLAFLGCAKCEHLRRSSNDVTFRRHHAGHHIPVRRLSFLFDPRVHRPLIPGYL